MKKALIGLVALGAVIALRPLVKRRMVEKMRDHCQQMVAHCQEMMAGAAGGRAKAAGREMPEPCEQTSESAERGEPVAAV